MEAPVRSIERVDFSLMDDNDIHENGVVRVSSSQLWNFNTNAPVPNGFLSQDMGALSRAYPCTTCGGIDVSHSYSALVRSNPYEPTHNLSEYECVGHPGYMELGAPVYTPSTIDACCTLLRCMCVYCGQLLASSTVVDSIVTPRLLALDPFTVLRRLASCTLAPQHEPIRCRDADLGGCGRIVPRVQLVAPSSSSSSNDNASGGGGDDDDGGHPRSSLNSPFYIQCTYVAPPTDGAGIACRDMLLRISNGRRVFRLLPLRAAVALKVMANGPGLRYLVDAGLFNGNIGTAQRAVRASIALSLTVPPPCARPFSVPPLSDDSDDVHDDVRQMRRILMASDNVSQVVANIQGLSVALKRFDDDVPMQLALMPAYEALQFNVNVWFDNAYSRHIPQSLGSRLRVSSNFKGLMNRLNRKHGRMRWNLMGKRVDYSARAVVTPDPHLSIDEIGLPRSMCQTLTVPVPVTALALHSGSIERLLRDHADDLVALIKPDGVSRTDLRNHPHIVDEDGLPAVGSVLHRVLRAGDIVVVNRQPSLHRASIMSFRVRPMPYSSIRVPIEVTTPFNMDFDGDEANVHVPQSYDAQVEARDLLHSTGQILLPSSNSPSMGYVQNQLTMARILSLRDTLLSRADAMHLLLSASFVTTNAASIPVPAIVRAVDSRTGVDAGPRWTGKQLISTTLPTYINRVDGDWVSLRQFVAPPLAAAAAKKRHYIVVANIRHVAQHVVDTIIVPSSVDSCIDRSLALVSGTVVACSETAAVADGTITCSITLTGTSFPVYDVPLSIVYGHVIDTMPSSVRTRLNVRESADVSVINGRVLTENARIPSHVPPTQQTHSPADSSVRCVGHLHLAPFAVDDELLYIRNGHVLAGTLNKSSVGRANGSLWHTIATSVFDTERSSTLYGENHRALATFVDTLKAMTEAFTSMHSFSIGIADMMLSGHVQSSRATTTAASPSLDTIAVQPRRSRADRRRIAQSMIRAASTRSRSFERTFVATGGAALVDMERRKAHDHAQKLIADFTRDHDDDDDDISASPAQQVALVARLEHLLVQKLQKTAERASEMAIADLRRTNRRNALNEMADSGAKGTQLNQMQIAACLGQQMRGSWRVVDTDYALPLPDDDVRPIVDSSSGGNGVSRRCISTRGLTFAGRRRALSHYERGCHQTVAKLSHDYWRAYPGARSGGFVANSFIDGIDPDEFFFHMMGGREGLIDTAVKTRETGYGSRRLAKALEDVVVAYDGSIRTCEKMIIHTRSEYPSRTDDRRRDTFDAVGRPRADVYHACVWSSTRIRRRDLLTAIDDERTQLDRALDATQMMYARDASMTKVQTYTPVSIDEIIDAVAAVPAFAPICTIMRHTNGVSVASRRYIVTRALARGAVTCIHRPAPPSLARSQDVVIVVRRLNAFIDRLRAEHCLFGEPHEAELRVQLASKRLLLTVGFSVAAIDELLRRLHEGYTRALLDAGTGVGMMAAQSVGENTQQLTLNTFHSAGSEKGSISGVPRLLEILSSVAAAMMKGPLVCVYVHPSYARSIEAPATRVDEQSRVAAARALVTTSTPLRIRLSAVAFETIIRRQSIVQSRALVARQPIVFDRRANRWHVLNIDADPWLRSHVDAHFEWLSLELAVRRTSDADARSRIRRWPPVHVFAPAAGSKRPLPVVATDKQSSRRTSSVKKKKQIVAATDDDDDSDMDMDTVADPFDSPCIASKRAACPFADDVDSSCIGTHVLTIVVDAAFATGACIPPETIIASALTNRDFKRFAQRRFIVWYEAAPDDESLLLRVRVRLCRERAYRLANAEKSRRRQNASNADNTTVSDAAAPSSSSVAPSPPPIIDESLLLTEFATELGRIVVTPSASASMAPVRVTTVYGRAIRASDRSLEDQETFVLTTTSRDFVQTLTTCGVDTQCTTTNNVAGILHALGAEAAVRAIVIEFEDVITRNGGYLDRSHFALAGDVMMRTGQWAAFNRHGMPLLNDDVFIHSTFETQAQVLVQAAVNCKSTPVQSPSASIALGQTMSSVGTGAFDCRLDVAALATAIDVPDLTELQHLVATRNRARRLQTLQSDALRFSSRALPNARALKGDVFLTVPPRTPMHAVDFHDPLPPPFVTAAESPSQEHPSFRGLIDDPHSSVVRGTYVPARFGVEWSASSPSSVPAFSPIVVRHDANPDVVASVSSSVFADAMPAYSPTSPAYSPTMHDSSPAYSPTSPAMPAYSPTSPAYSPTMHDSSPAYSPTSPAMPAYSPTSPAYSPTMHDSSPAYSPTSPTFDCLPENTLTAAAIPPRSVPRVKSVARAFVDFAPSYE